jgi:hypothetical protein
MRYSCVALVLFFNVANHCIQGGKTYPKERIFKDDNENKVEA